MSSHKLFRDEFASLGPTRQIEDAAGQIAGYGVKLWPILQDLGQLNLDPRAELA